ncbi:MAG: hypothetical protein C0502_05700 [Opitutus sp.]|nr:hypothetical protein [Opitutus sp.]
MEIRFTLVGDGPFDCALLPIIRWALGQNTRVSGFYGEFADPRRLPKLGEGLRMRLLTAVEFYPCNLLFVHRDAESQTREQRLQEIHEASRALRSVHVPIIPIRMTEAWLLFAEDAIRRAAGNPNGTAALNLPPLNRVERRIDPKYDLRQALLGASMLSGRQLRKFDENAAAKRVAELITDFAPLRQLSAFRDFETDLARALSVI